MKRSVGGHPDLFTLCLSGPEIICQILRFKKHISTLFFFSRTPIEIFAKTNYRNVFFFLSGQFCDDRIYWNWQTGESRSNFSHFVSLYICSRWTFPNYIKFADLWILCQRICEMRPGSEATSNENPDTGSLSSLHVDCSARTDTRETKIASGSKNIQIASRPVCIHPTP